MISETARRAWTTPPQKLWWEAVRTWKHGVLVLFTLTLAGVTVALSALAVWLVLNAGPLLVLEDWTLDRSLNAFGWTASIWLPMAYSLGARYLPPRSESAN
jgi:hypothetical protein